MVEEVEKGLQLCYCHRLELEEGRGVRGGGGRGGEEEEQCKEKGIEE